VRLVNFIEIAEHSAACSNEKEQKKPIPSTQEIYQQTKNEEMIATEMC